MSIKIKQIQIQNFKLFKNLSTIEFDNPSLIIFDGPNGFGKTSFYDAIELLFTGKLRRYTSLSNDIIDNRQNLEGNPLVCNYSQEDDDLIIKVNVEINGYIYFLMRKENCHTIKENGNLFNFTLPLYLLDSFDDLEGNIVNGEEFFNELLGVDFHKNFEFLNYIEQEENIYLLKNKDKDRKKNIAHLFNTEEFQSKIEVLNVLHRKMTSACNAQAKSEYKEVEVKLDEYLRAISTDTEEVEYFTFFEWKDIIWDRESLNFTDIQYSQWIGEDGELKKLDFFIKNFDEFQKKMKNEKIDKLFENIVAVKQVLLYHEFLDKEEELSSKLLINTKFRELFTNFENGLLEAIKNKKISIPSEIKELVKAVIDIERYIDEIDRIAGLISNVDALSRLLNNVKESREIFIQKYTDYHSVNPTTSCPLCGHDWEDTDELIRKFEEQTNVLKELLKSTGDELSPAIEEFDKVYLKPLKEFFEEYQKNNPIDTEFIRSLKQIKQSEQRVIELKEKFISFDINIKSLLGTEPKIIDLEEKIESLKALAEEKKETVEEEKVKEYFSDYFIKYFNESIENTSTITSDRLGKKKQYIEWQYYIYQNSEAQRLQSEYDAKKASFNNAKALKLKIKKIKDIYTDSLREYQTKLVREIEILFHIYSGRIMQDCQNGLGLFIKSDQDEIRFIESGTMGSSSETDYNKYDAVFTMSSGQLASLIISFTLALNKRYSKSKLLLIDDPVQTLDELNIAGLVNLLRNEFFDRQIYMSTHEPMMSAYMRYKFEKFGLHTERINFKEKYLEDIG